MRISDPQSLVGTRVVGADGEKIGEVDQVYFDTESNEPEWVSVKTGWFGTNVSLVPLAQATATGDELRVPFDKKRVSDAPNQDPSQDLSPEDEQRLYEYYGLAYRSGDMGSGRTAGEAYETTASDAARAEQAREATRPAAGDAMTRSEEQLRVDRERVETGRARLRKYVVTENVQQTIPVSREEVRVEREPITEANRDAATGGPEISESEHEVTLTEERPVVSKEVVPQERVRLSKETQTGEQEVSEEVRKEQIETEGDDPGRYRRP